MIAAACEIELKADIPRLTFQYTSGGDFAAGSARRPRSQRAAADLLIQSSWQPRGQHRGRVRTSAQGAYGSLSIAANANKSGDPEYSQIS